MSALKHLNVALLCGNAVLWAFVVTPLHGLVWLGAAVALELVLQPEDLA